MPPKRGKEKKSTEKKTFCLLRWIEDETVSVLPVTAAKTGQKVYPGVYGDFKWLKKVYEAQVLKVSDDRQALLRDCDRLVKMDITSEEILNEVETIETVDSTTDVEPSPAKKPRTAKCDKMARMTAARGRAKALLSSLDSDSDDDVHKGKMKMPKKEYVDPDSGGYRRKKKLKTFQRENDDYDSYIEEDDHKRVLEAEIKMLKEKLAKRNKSVSPPAVNVTNNTIRNSSFEALQKITIPGSDVEPAKVSMDITPSSSPTPQPYKRLSEAGTSHSPTGLGMKGIRPSSAGPARMGTSPASSQVYKVQPKAIELVPGYGVFLTQKQLDMAVDGAKNSPTRLIRNLMNVFFTPETLATSSACGTRKHKALDGDIVQACIHFVRSQFEHVSKSTLVDCINDKCANYRRKQ